MGGFVVLVVADGQIRFEWFEKCNSLHPTGYDSSKSSRHILYMYKYKESLRMSSLAGIPNSGR